MSEKLYKPIIKDGDHLVRSSKNPKRVRGQSRDSNNKNPDIIEWEEVEVSDEGTSNDSDNNDSLERLKTINNGLDALNNFLVFLNDHPEFIETLLKGGKRAKVFVADRIKNTKNFLSKISKKAVSKIKGLFISKTNSDVIEPQNVERMDVDENYSFDVQTQDGVSDEAREDMSVDEARKLILEILANYINMKRNYDRLSKARINGIDVPDLGMDQVLACLDDVIKQYPSLMDDKTSFSVMNLLKSNTNDAENRKIREVLHIR